LDKGFESLIDSFLFKYELDKNDISYWYLRTCSWHVNDQCWYALIWLVVLLEFQCIVKAKMCYIYNTNDNITMT
jgi:hypothetical protein